MSSEFTQCNIMIEKLAAATSDVMHDSMADEASPNTPKLAFSLDDIEIFITQKHEDEECKEAGPKRCQLSIIEDSIILSIPYPFLDGQLLSIAQRQSSDLASVADFDSQTISNPLKGLTVDLNSLDFSTSSSTTYTYQHAESLTDFKLLFDLSTPLPLQPLLTSRVSPTERHFRFDFSGHNLPLKPKKFSFFKSVPLYSFFELICLSPTLPSTTSPAIGTAQTSVVLWESDISKIVSCDPFWTVTDPMPLSLLEPRFRLNIYQSIDMEKSKRALVAQVDIDIHEVVGMAQETMFEVPGTGGKTLITVDRIQEVGAPKLN